MAAPNTFAGPRARYSIGGVAIGYGTDVSGGESYQYDEIDVLGVLEVLEYVAVGYRATMQSRIFRVIGRSLKSLGVFPTLSAALTSGDLSAGIEDSITGEVPYQFIGVKAQDKHFNGSARTSFAEDVSFVATKLIDESERPAGG